MKKVLIMAAIAVFGFTSVQAQEGGIKAGINFGLPMGDAADITTFAVGADFAYLFSVADSFQVGPLVGYAHFFGDKMDFMGFTVEIDDIQFLPVAASARFFASEDLFFGADLGYAVGINDGNDGGFYYRPKAGYNLGSIGLILSYQGISADGGSFSSLNVGVEFGF
jgi:hypothetical protein